MLLNAQPVSTALLSVCDSHIAGKSHLVDVTPGEWFCCSPVALPTRGYLFPVLHTHTAQGQCWRMDPGDQVSMSTLYREDSAVIKWVSPNEETIVIFPENVIQPNA